MVRTEPASAQFPYPSQLLNVDGPQLAYIDAGDPAAPPVLMVHGNPTWSFYYRKLIQALEPTHRCVAVDHIGCGRSDKPGDDAYPYTLARRVSDLSKLVDALDLRDVTLVVHDWGGMIGFAWAVANRARVKRLVVLNTAAFLNPKGLSLPPALWLARNTWVGTVLVRGLNAFARGAVWTCTTRGPLPRDVAAAYLAPYDSWQARIATLRFVQDIPLSPSDKAYGVVEATAEGLGLLVDLPMQIHWGMQDFVFDAAFLAEWERRFPAAEVHRYEDAGHYILEDAASEIVPRVVDFLSRT